jgi:ribosomal-protein-alanine N-acetyltransferase
MASQPMLSTARLQLLPPEAPWARAVRDYQLRNRAHLAPWEPTRGDMYFTELFWGMRLREHIEEFRNGRGALFLVMHDKQPGQVIGTVHLSNIVRGAFQACHLGYSIDHGFEGQGMMAEAVQAVIDYAFGELALHRIQANYQPNNARSARLLQKLGFEVEGQAKDYLFLNGAWRDHVLTSLRNPGFDTNRMRS